MNHGNPILVICLFSLLLGGCLTQPTTHNDDPDQDVPQEEEPKLKRDPPVANQTHTQSDWLVESIPIPAFTNDTAIRPIPQVSAQSPYLMAFGQISGNEDGWVGLFDPVNRTWNTFVADTTQQSPVAVWGGWTGEAVYILIDYTTPGANPAIIEGEKRIVVWDGEWHTIPMPVEWTSQRVQNVAVSPDGLAVLLEAPGQATQYWTYESEKWKSNSMLDWDRVSFEGIGHDGEQWILSSRDLARRLVLLTGGPDELTEIDFIPPENPTSAYTKILISETTGGAASIAWIDMSIQENPGGFQAHVASSRSLTNNTGIGPGWLYPEALHGASGDAWLIIDDPDGAVQIWHDGADSWRECKGTVGENIKNLGVMTLWSHGDATYVFGRLIEQVDGMAYRLDGHCP